MSRDMSGILQRAICDRPGCEWGCYESGTPCVLLASGEHVCITCIKLASEAMCHVCGAHPPMPITNHEGIAATICYGCALGINGHNLGGTIAGWVQHVAGATA